MTLESIYVTSEETLGKFLARNRRKRGMSQVDLKNALNQAGVTDLKSEITILHWEKDRHRPPLSDADFVHTLSQLLDVRERDLLLAAGFTEEQLGQIKNPPAELPDWFVDFFKNATPSQKRAMQRFANAFSEDEESDEKQ